MNLSLLSVTLSRYQPILSRIFLITLWEILQNSIWLIVWTLIVQDLQILLNIVENNSGLAQVCAKSGWQHGYIILGIGGHSNDFVNKQLSQWVRLGRDVLRRFLNNWLSLCLGTLFIPIPPYVHSCRVDLLAFLRNCINILTSHHDISTSILEGELLLSLSDCILSLNLSLLLLLKI